MKRYDIIDADSEDYKSRSQKLDWGRLIETRKTGRVGGSRDNHRSGTCRQVTLEANMR